MVKKIKPTKEQVEHYANLPYTVVVTEDDAHGIYYIAEVLELPNLVMTGDTPAEAIAELEAVKRDWIETYLELGNKMPEPLQLRKYSGKINLRIPSSLHKIIAKMAELEGISLNQYMVSVLSKAAGEDNMNLQMVVPGKTKGK